MNPLSPPGAPLAGEFEMPVPDVYSSQHRSRVLSERVGCQTSHRLRDRPPWTRLAGSPTRSAAPGPARDGWAAGAGRETRGRLPGSCSGCREPDNPRLRAGGSARAPRLSQTAAPAVGSQTQAPGAHPHDPLVGCCPSGCLIAAANISGAARSGLSFPTERHATPRHRRGTEPRTARAAPSLPRASPAHAHPVGGCSRQDTRRLRTDGLTRSPAAAERRAGQCAGGPGPSAAGEDRALCGRVPAAGGGPGNSGCLRSAVVCVCRWGTRQEAGISGRGGLWTQLGPAPGGGVLSGPGLGPVAGELACRCTTRRRSHEERVWLPGATN